ncbi:hypothetical protein [Aestuariimicrobium sp. Y1814]|uniref:hypothetical protein n=1 Tax=Aestuariimicrobium sp. Y1814 TaxID=3418742 RepID=UPI003DA7399C
MGKNPRPVIGFQKLTCRRCSAERIRGQVCISCGMKPDPREVDEHTAARRKLVAPLLTTLEQRNMESGALPTPHDAEDLRRIILNTVNDFRQGVAAIGQSTPSVTALEEAISRFHSRDTALGSIERRRPQLDLHDAAQVTRIELHQFACHQLTALQVATPLEAQRHASAAQERLDTALAAVHRLTEHEEMVGAISDQTVQDSARSMFRVLLEEYGDISSLLNGSDDEVRRLVDRTPQPGVGLQFALGRLAARLFGDAELFSNNFVQTYRALTTDRTLLQKCVSESARLQADVSEKLITSQLESYSFSRLAANALSQRHLFSSALSLNEILVESSGSVIVRLLLLACGIKSTTYDKLLTQNATEHLRAARNSATLAACLAGLDEHLRIARAHHQVQFEGDALIATARGISKAYSVEGIVDQRMLAITITNSGMLAVQQALSELGVDVDQNLLMEHMGIGLDTQVEVALGLFSGTTCTASFSGDLLHLNVRGGASVSLLALMGGVSRVINDSADRFELDYASDDSTEVFLLRGPLGGFRAFEAATNPFEREVLLVESTLGITMKGGPILTQNQVRHFAALYALKTMGQTQKEISVLEAGRRFRILRGLGELAKDEVLIETLRQCSRWLGQGDNTRELCSLLDGFIDSDSAFDLP